MPTWVDIANRVYSSPTATTSGFGIYTAMNNATTATTVAAPIWWSNQVEEIARMTATTSGFGTAFAWYDEASETWTVDDMHHSQYFALAQQRISISRQYTAEQQRQIEEQGRLNKERWERERREREEATARAQALLLAHLTPAQRRTFEKNNWFVVHGGKTDTKYRIRGGSYAGNIDVYQGDRVSHRLCCHCSSHIPLGDQLLAQKLCLQYDEEAFVRMANRHAA